MTIAGFSDPVELWPLFQRAVPDAFLQDLCRSQHLRIRRGIYSWPLLVWLMIFQRLNPKHTLSASVHWLAARVKRLPAAYSCKRIREGRISTRTGGYCQARQKMPTLVAIHMTDRLFEQLQQRMQEEAPEPAPVFVVDGTTIRTAWGKDLSASFPPGGNQHGQNHWPTLLVVVFHDAHTGLAARPSWSAMYGAEAASEQQLAAEGLPRLPAHAIVLGDRGFGIFEFTYAVHQSGRVPVVRLTHTRARKILGKTTLRPGRRRKVVWEASGWELKAHPGLPPQASVEGWLVAGRNPGRRDEILYFFTTLDEKPTRILGLYGLRWNIETDLRSLKRTAHLHQIESKTPSMVSKELLMAVSSYNLVRAAMFLAAHRAGISPRQLSFSTSQDAMMAAFPDLQPGRTHAAAQRAMEQLMNLLLQARLPNRSRKRKYPRQIWGRGGHFPFRPSTPANPPNPPNN
jgi:putative transposase